MKSFASPMKSLGNLDAEAAATLIAAAADVALIIDEHGVITDAAFQSEALGRELEAAGGTANGSVSHGNVAHRGWIGRPWAATVSPDSRGKVEALLRDASAHAPPRWRHLNHPLGRDGQLPIQYSAIRLGGSSRFVAFGRDLRAISDLQQRLVDAQQSLEKDYSRLRQFEMRYRLLFQMSSEAVLIIDATSMKVTEANPAAHRLFDDSARKVLARGLTQAFDAEGAAAVHALLNTVRVAGRADDIKVRLDGQGGAGREVSISVSLFREEQASLFLVRIDPAGDGPAAPVADARSNLLKLIERAPDGFVVISTDSRIMSANAAFLEMAQLPSEEAARDQSIERWLGRQGVDVDVLLANLRQRSTVRLFATIMRGEFGAAADVEVSAVALVNAGQSCYGLAIRNVGRRLSGERPNELPRSVEQLTDLIGRVSLKELVRQSTDVIERLCIETALKMTGDNRASAAEILGLSRQSFYVKLRRYGLGDLGPDSGPAETTDMT